MLRLILDTRDFERENPELAGPLSIDLRRMEKLDHGGMPRGANAARVVPEKGSYSDSITYYVQYGVQGEDGRFTPVGRPVRYPHEVLPYL